MRDARSRAAFRPTSWRQHADAVARLPSATEEFADGIWSVSLAVDSGTVSHSLCYLLFDSENNIHVIDPGMETDENRQLLLKGIAAAGGGLADVRSILVTHHHRDHIGLADWLRRATGAQLVLHSAEQAAIDEFAVGIDDDLLDRWGVPDSHRSSFRATVRARSSGGGKVRADLLVDDGDVLAIPGRHVEVVWTPGHTTGHVCFRGTEERILFTGDHVLPLVNPGLGLGGSHRSNALADYLASLARLEPFDDHVVCPGHGYRFRGLLERSGAIAAHQLARNDEVAAFHAQLPDASIWEVAQAITWTGGWSGLHGSIRISALRQTEMHLDYLKWRGA